MIYGDCATVSKLHIGPKLMVDALLYAFLVAGS